MINHSFENDMVELIQKHGVGKEFGIPDYILWVYLENCLDSLVTLQRSVRRHAEDEAVKQARRKVAQSYEEGRAWKS